MRFRCLAAVLVLVGLGLTSCSSTSSSSSSGTGFLYVTTQSDNSLSEYTVDLNTGIPTISGSSIATGTVPSAMILTPDGKTLFVANEVSDDISAFTVNSDGSASTVSGTQPAGNTPLGLSMDSAGKFLFVANQGTFADPTSGTVSVYGVQGTSLSEVAGSPFPTALPGATTGTGSTSVAVTPDGKYLYVANQFINTVTGYAVDSSGALTPLPVPSYNVGLNPSSVFITPDGNFLYVANSGSNNISAFVICDNATPACPSPDGSLAAVKGSPFSAGLGPGAMIASPANPVSKFLFVVDQQSSQISEFKISAGTGVLATNTAPAISTGLNPVAITLELGGPAIAATGGTTEYVYVVNSGTSSISSYNYDSTVGGLGLISTSSEVTTNGQPSAVVGH
jgi:6-phosphogluconolactonase (cycloisomerase 2 family)